MAQLLALEWDQFEARIVVAQQRGEDVRIDHALTVSLAPRDPGQTFADTDVGQRLQAALAARRIGKAETLVAVGRSSIELRRLTLPPAPEDEWPDLVRFQALPQFSNLGEDWTLDFFPLHAESGEGSSVLAAAISPQLVEQISNTCHSAGLNPSRLVLRPCAAASLLIRRGGAAAQRLCLFVDVLADEADLTVLLDRGVVLMRTVRLPAASADSPAAHARALSGEIRRTIASAQNQLGGRRVEQIILCGDRDEHRELSKQLAERLKLPIEHFDPFDSLRLSAELQAKPPQKPERFAPLLGMVLDEGASRRHAIDFLHPRRQAAPPSKRRWYAIAGGLVAAALLALAAIGWMEIAALESRIAALEQTSQQLDDDVEQAEAILQQVNTIETWHRGNTHWLDELEHLSRPENFPPAEDARLSGFKAARQPQGGGQLSLSGYARAAEVIPEVESRLRDQRRTVVSGPSRKTETDPRYPWRFQETVKIAPRADVSIDDADSPTGGRR